MRTVLSIILFFSVFLVQNGWADSIKYKNVTVEFNIPKEFVFTNNYLPNEADFSLSRDPQKRLGYKIQIRIETPQYMQNETNLISGYMNALALKKQTPNIDDYYFVYKNNFSPALMKESQDFLYGEMEKIKIKDKWLGENAFWMNLSDPPRTIGGTFGIDCQLITSVGLLHIEILFLSDDIISKMALYGTVMPNGLQLSSQDQAVRIFQESRAKKGVAPKELRNMWDIYNSIIKSISIDDLEYEKWYGQHKDQVKTLQ